MAITPRWITLAAATLLSGTIATSPVQVPFSKNAYGFDGPWPVVNVSVGTPPQQVELFPGSYYWTPVLSNKFCDNSNFTASGYDCYAEDTGFYDVADSGTSRVTPNSTKWPLWSGSIAMNGRVRVVRDQFTFGDYVTPIILMFATDWAYYIMHDQREIPVPMGQLSLGAPQRGISPEGGWVPSSGLYISGKTSSASFGMHLGSAAPSIPGGIPGSLWFGGYDANRVLGPVLNSTAFPLFPNMPLGLAGLSYTTLSTEPGAQNRTNIASERFSESPLVVGIATMQQYILLPRDVCDGLTDTLPIIYNATADFYLWDTEDPAYTDTLINGPNYFTFTFDNSLNSDQPVKINVPLALLHLTLTPPLVETPTPYFPCTTLYGDAWTLGQAFLQAAFVGANWLPNPATGGDMQYYLAQAPGPGLDSNPSPLEISDNVNENSFKTIPDDSFALWARSWYPFFNQYGGSNLEMPPLPAPSPASSDEQPASPPGSSTQNSDDGLSGGAIAGIVVGTVLGVSLIVGIFAAIIVRRRRQQHYDDERRSELADQKLEEMDGSSGVNEAADSERKGELKGDGGNHEMPTDNVKYELESPDTPAIAYAPIELSARGDNVVEPGSVQGTPRIGAQDAKY